MMKSNKFQTSSYGVYLVSVVLISKSFQIVLVQFISERSLYNSTVQAGPYAFPKIQRGIDTE